MFGGDALCVLINCTISSEWTCYCIVVDTGHGDDAHGARWDTCLGYMATITLLLFTMEWVGG